MSWKLFPRFLCCFWSGLCQFQYKLGEFLLNRLLKVLKINYLSFLFLSIKRDILPSWAKLYFIIQNRWLCPKQRVFIAISKEKALTVIQILNTVKWRQINITYLSLSDDILLVYQQIYFLCDWIFWNLENCWFLEDFVVSENCWEKNYCLGLGWGLLAYMNEAVCGKALVIEVAFFVSLELHHKFLFT